jgi:regulator of replication initiation timing
MVIMALLPRAMWGIFRGRNRTDRRPGPEPERRPVVDPPPAVPDPAPAQELEELLVIADAELVEKQQRLDELDRRYQEVVEDQCRLEEENNRLRGRLTTVYRGLAPDETPPPCELPTTADSPSHAAELARLHLSDHLSLPPEACVQLDKIDNMPESRTWGENAWRGFLALHAYGEALAGQDNPGNFRAWCENSHHRHVWPSNAKKLAMSESKTVGRSSRMSAKRMFPVDRAYDPSGAVFMEAHLKIGVGRGTLLPRVYFVADRETAKVYVGYFGSHKNVPNTLT